MATFKNATVGFAALIVFLIAFPFLFTSYALNVLTEILIMSIFALGLNVLLGYTGLVSLGHAAFFGVGAYTAGILALHFNPNFFLTLLAGVLLSTLVAAMIGFFCNRVSGFYFLMLTLAFSQMIYAVVHQWRELTGGTNGLSGIPRPTLFPGVSLQDPVSFYFLILAFFLIVFIFLKRFLASPLGQIFVGIRENEARVRAIGYHATLYKNLSFMISGGISGIAGSLYAYFNGFVSPDNVYWTVSGEVLIMVLIGGAGTLFGPVLGAAFIVILETIVSSYTDMWMLIVGITFILFVIFAPKGIVGVSGLFRKSRGAENERDPSLREEEKISIANRIPMNRQTEEKVEI